MFTLARCTTTIRIPFLLKWCAYKSHSHEVSHDLRLYMTLFKPSPLPSTQTPPHRQYGALDGVENTEMFLNSLWSKYNCRGCNWFWTWIKLSTVAIHYTRLVCLTLYKMLKTVLDIHD